VCHTDLHYTDHDVPTFKKPPLILGHEISGTVVSGPGFAAGERVLLPAVLACGDCGYCRAGRSNICQNMKMFGNHVDGGFAEFAICPSKQAFRLPAEIALDEACVIGDAITTAFHAVLNRGKVKEGDWVAVFGCGGVGVNVVQVAAAAGAKVLAVDKSPSKLQLALSMGAARGIEPGEGMIKEIRTLTGGGSNVSFECIGNPAVIRQAHESIRRGGRLVIVGFSEKPAELAVSRIMFHEQDVVGSLGCPPEEFPKVIEWVRQGRLKVSPLITGRFGLSEINAALDTLRAGMGLRNIVEVRRGK
jgi:D-arabinose 1-dehydrogenase-like Zn-dependent alcohol dehydrogenase